MKFLSAFLVLTVFCLGAIFFVHAAKQPKLNITGLHTRACFDTRWSPLSHDMAASRRGTLLFFSNVPR